MLQKVSKFLNKRSVRYGLPFLLVVVGGSFGLKEFTELRYIFSKRSNISLREDIKKSGLEMKKPGEVSLETEYERLKTMDIDTWEQVRGPRPWEETASG